VGGPGRRNGDHPEAGIESMRSVPAEDSPCAWNDRHQPTADPLRSELDMAAISPTRVRGPQPTACPTA
jgi:hypothetical protein